jgi:hypothetical protein
MGWERREDGERPEAAEKKKKPKKKNQGRIGALWMLPGLASRYRQWWRTTREVRQVLFPGYLCAAHARVVLGTRAGTSVSSPPRYPRQP